MANIMDYLDWRGDLSFQESPFNEVDNLILSEIPYVDLEGIVPYEEEGAIGVREAAELFFEQHDREEIMKRISMTKTAPFVLEKMAATRRFRDTRLFRYVNEISREEESQFCAVCMILPDASYFVAFSGTDSTLIGWKEDFNMSFLSEIPGQLKAVEYLTYFERKQVPIRVGGHSKGGNLAVYGAMYSEEPIREKILEVYSNDGPGFLSQEIEKPQYYQILDRVYSIVPQASIVGRLLEHGEKTKVVKSDQSGAMQHDGLSWQVLGNQFVESEKISDESRLVERTVKAWVHQLEFEDREQFVDALFHILEDADIHTTEELAKIRWKNFSEMLKAYTHLGKENQEMITKVLKMLWKESNRIIKLTRMEKKQKRLLEKMMHENEE